MNEKVIKVTITLNGGTEYFTSEWDNQLSSTGLAVSCNLNYGNGAITPTAQITIYGLTMQKMLKLMRVQWNTMQALLNTVKVEVGERGSELTVAYEGNITQATIDANNAPDVPLIITSQMAVYEKAKVTAAYVLEKNVQMDAALIVEELAVGMGYQFTNDGVTHIVTDVTLEGSDLEKIQKLATMCDFDLYVEQKLIAICKRGTARTLSIPIVSPKNGNLIGYPVPDIKGVSFACLYDPNIKFGGIIRIRDSIIDVCNADWRLYGYTAQLEANIPNGKWQINANATWRDSKDAAVQR